MEDCNRLFSIAAYVENVVSCVAGRVGSLYRVGDGLLASVCLERFRTIVPSWFHVPSEQRPNSPEVKLAIGHEYEGSQLQVEPHRDLLGTEEDRLVLAIVDGCELWLGPIYRLCLVYWACVRTLIVIVSPFRIAAVVRVACEWAVRVFVNASESERVVLNEAYVAGRRVYPINVRMRGVRCVHGDEDGEVNTVFRIGMLSFVLRYRFYMLGPYVAVNVSVVHADLGCHVHPLARQRRFQLRSRGLNDMQYAMFSTNLTLLNLLHHGRGRASYYAEAVSNYQDVFRGISELGVQEISVAGDIYSFMYRSVGSGRQVNEINQCNAAGFRAPTFVAQNQ